MDSEINYNLFMPRPRPRTSKSFVAGIIGSVGLLAISAVIVAAVFLGQYSTAAVSPVALGASLSLPAPAPTPPPAPPAPAAVPATPDPPAPAAAPATTTAEEVKQARPAKKRIARAGKARAGKARAGKARAGKATHAKATKRPDAKLRQLLGI